MKKTAKLLLCTVLVLSMTLCLMSCGKTEGDIWADALYTEDTELGEGSKTLTVKVEAAEKTVTFTVHTDKPTVGEALQELDIIDGEEGPYGLYVKFVNGIEADYNKNGAYWAFNKDGGYMSTGVDKTEFSDGDSFELVYTKE